MNGIYKAVLKVPAISIMIVGAVIIFYSAQHQFVEIINKVYLLMGGLVLFGLGINYLKLTDIDIILREAKEELARE